MRGASAAIALASALLLSSGCDACSRMGKVAKAHTKSPEKSTIEDAVKKRLEQARELASQLCGVPASGLTDIRLEVVDTPMLGSSNVKVTGVAVALPAASASASMQPSASPPPAAPSAGSALRAAACTGVVYVFMSPDVAEDGTVTRWKLEKVEVQEVTTPGHEWKRPPEDHDHD